MEVYFRKIDEERFNKVLEIPVNLKDAIEEHEKELALEEYKTDSYIIKYNKNWNLIPTVDTNRVGPNSIYLGALELEIPSTTNSEYTSSMYVKVTDECDFITYASTPLVIYEGYVVSNLKPINYNTGNTITKKSIIMFDIDYSNNRQLNITHNLVTSTPLPQGTKIIMMDKINNKSYQYVVNTNTSTYPLTLFSEIGKNTVNYIFIYYKQQM